MGYDELYWTYFEKSGSLEAYISYKFYRGKPEVTSGNVEGKRHSIKGDTGWGV